MSEVQLPLFEKGYFQRTLGRIILQADVALTELVANCWDAGAALVTVTIPEEYGGTIQISDDGVGMTAEEFSTRWRTLAYDRLRHQGPGVDFPPGATRRPRSAYGRNGIGRHAMFCFSDQYEVQTSKGEKRILFIVKESFGENALEIGKVKEWPSRTHGTTLRAVVSRVLPRAEEILEILAARFMYDPEFIIKVNGKTLDLIDHSGLLLQKEYQFYENLRARLYVLSSGETARTKFQHGVAFWVDNRLVGEPSWQLGPQSLLDGRTKEAKRLTFIVKLECLHEAVLPDWSGFKDTPAVQGLYATTAEQVKEVLLEMLAGRVQERTQEIIESRREEVDQLDPLARLEVAEFTRKVTEAQPFVTNETLEAAVDALIRLENSRSGQALIQKLSVMQPDDIIGLNRLLEEWTLRDALTVLDEIGKRIRVIEAIEKLSKDPTVDELHTLHPLITQARWLFGPEYDTPHYISNVTLRTALSKLVGNRVDASTIENPRKRPDLLLLQDATLSATAVEGFNDDGLASLEKILLLELKRGDSSIGRAEMQQAEEYVEELMNSPDLDGDPTIHAFVVGHRVNKPRASQRTIGERGKITACSFSQLVRTANRRLFALRERVSARYPEGADVDLIRAVSAQANLFDLQQEVEWYCPDVDESIDGK